MGGGYRPGGRPGGPWSYDEEPSGEATGADKEFLDGGSLAPGPSSAVATHMRQRGRGAATIRSACRSSS
jgi:hypothetical protein